ncbi:MAG: cytochrome c oxidase assembly protein [Firmicutes bacterium]|nr:cytochrome c oxidase assembly protein [Bacillota bacterium]
MGLFFHEIGVMFGIESMWNPSAVVVLLLAIAAYSYGCTRVRQADEDRVTVRHNVFFGLSALIFALAFASPLDAIASHDLFSVHTFVHLLEIMLMTPLLIAGLPVSMLRGLLRTLRVPPRSFHPAVIVIAFNVIFFSFHLPPLFDETLVSGWFHLLEHILFFVAAFFLWMPVLSPLPEVPRLKPGPLLLYAFFTVNFTMPGQILLVLAQRVFYSYPVASITQFGLSPVQDQQLGFLLMIAGMFVPFLGVAIYAFSRYDNSRWYS